MWAHKSGQMDQWRRQKWVMWRKKKAKCGLWYRLLATPESHSELHVHSDHTFWGCAVFWLWSGAAMTMLKYSLSALIRRCFHHNRMNSERAGASSPSMLSRCGWHKNSDVLRLGLLSWSSHFHYRGPAFKYTPTELCEYNDPLCFATAREQACRVFLCCDVVASQANLK